MCQHVLFIFNLYIFFLWFISGTMRGSVILLSFIYRYNFCSYFELDLICIFFFHFHFKVLIFDCCLNGFRF